MPQNSTSEVSASTQHAPRWPLLLLGLTWVAMELAVWPAGDFPLNDDWSYSQPVRSVLEEGRFRLSGWTSMPLVAQVAWGALFCMPFGFSHVALRLSTLVAALVALMATYGFARETGASRQTALMLALVLAVNPVFFCLANTFMTDVPFLSAAMTSLFLLARGMNREKPALLSAGIVAAAAATLIRQAGLVIPVAFCLAYLWKNRPVNLRNILVCILSMATVAVPLLAYNALLAHSGSTPAMYDAKTSDLLGRLHTPLLGAGLWIVNIAISAVYLGLFLLPASIATARPGLARPLYRHIAAVLLAAAATTVLTLTGRLMPIIGNILHNVGLGPIRLHDVHVLGLPHWPSAPSWVLVIVTFVAVLAAFYTFPSLVAQLRKTAVERRPVFILAVSASVLYLAPLAMVGMFDRYLLLLIPLLGAVLCATTNAPGQRLTPASGGLAALLLLALLAFSVCATRDYFAWNRARWQAAADLMDKQRVPWQKIDGGFEFNGMHGYDAGSPGSPISPSGESKSWWWVRDNEYVLAMGPIAGYEIEGRYGFVRTVPPGRGSILVLHRKTVDHQ